MYLCLCIYHLSISMYVLCVCMYLYMYAPIYYLYLFGYPCIHPFIHHLSLYLSIICLPIYIYVSIYLSIHPSLHLATLSQSIHPFFYHLSTYPPTYFLPIYRVSIHMFTYLLCMYQESLEPGTMRDAKGPKRKLPPSRQAGSYLATLREGISAHQLPPHLSIQLDPQTPQRCYHYSEATSSSPPT